MNTKRHKEEQARYLTLAAQLGGKDAEAAIRYASLYAEQSINAEKRRLLLERDEVINALRSLIVAHRKYTVADTDVIERALLAIAKCQ